MAQINQIQDVLAAYADALKLAGAADVAGDLRLVASALEQWPVPAMAGLAKTTSEQPSPNRQNWPRIVEHIEGLAEILSAGKSNAKVTKGLMDLCTVLKQFDESQTLSGILDALRDAMQPKPIDNQIDDFVARLNAGKGTPSFERTFSELVRSDLKREHVVSIALAVYGGIKKSTSRKAALEFIRKPHEGRLSARRGIDATGGRSAA